MAPRALAILAGGLLAAGTVFGGTGADANLQEEEPGSAETIDRPEALPRATDSPGRPTAAARAPPSIRTPSPVGSAPTHGNLAPLAEVRPPGARTLADGDLSTFWGGIPGGSGAYLAWAEPVTINRLSAWNAGGEPLTVAFSDRTGLPLIDMVSDGPRCADVYFPPRSVTWVHVRPFADTASRIREVHVWAAGSPQYSSFWCWNVRVMTPVRVAVADPGAAGTPTATPRGGRGGHPGLWTTP